MISESAEEARRRWEYWLKGKRAEVIARTHLSLVTAVLLAGGVMWREWSDLVHTLMALNLVEWSLFVAIITSPIVVARYLWIWTIFDEPGWREDVVVWTVLTVLFLSLPALPNLVTKVIRVENQNPLSFPVLILTAATLGAAIWEILGEKLGSSERDVRFALHVHKLLRLLDGFYITNDGNTPPDRALEEFTQEVIESACETLCGRKVVSGGYLQRKRVLTAALYRSFGEPTVSTTGRDGHFGRVA